MNNLNVTIRRRNTKYANDEILKNAIALTANDPKLRGNNRNFPNCNTDKCIAVPNEGNR